MKTNWLNIGRKIGAIEADKTIGSGGSKVAMQALEEILGDEWIHDAVDTSIHWKEGSNISNSCLRHIQSERAAKYCFSVYQNTSDQETKNGAVQLLMHMATPQSIHWVEEILYDESIAPWGFHLLSEL